MVPSHAIACVYERACSCVRSAIVSTAIVSIAIVSMAIVNMPSHKHLQLREVGLSSCVSIVTTAIVSRYLQLREVGLLLLCEGAELQAEVLVTEPVPLESSPVREQ